MNGLQTVLEAIVVVWGVGCLGKIGVTVAGCSVFAVVDETLKGRAGRG